MLALQVELTHPGAWVPGFIGITCLALATYGLGVLPVNWFGLVFIVTAFVLFLLDIKAPTHGALTAAGVASFIVGALVLFNSPGVPAFERVSVPLVVGVGMTIGLMFAGILTYALRAQGLPLQTGHRNDLGKIRHCQIGHQAVRTGAGGIRTLDRGSRRGLRVRSAGATRSRSSKCDGYGCTSRCAKR